MLLRKLRILLQKQATPTNDQTAHYGTVMAATLLNPGPI